MKYFAQRVWSQQAGSRIKVPATCLAKTRQICETRYTKHFPVNKAAPLLFFTIITFLQFYTTDLSDGHWDKIEKAWAEPEQNAEMSRATEIQDAQWTQAKAT